MQAPTLEQFLQLPEVAIELVGMCPTYSIQRWIRGADAKGQTWAAEVHVDPDGEVSSPFEPYPVEMREATVAMWCRVS